MKWMVSLMVLVMLVAACSRSPGPGGGSDNGPVLAGTLNGWSGGTATIAAESFGEGPDPIGTVASAELTADGSFRLELPETVSEALLVTTDASVICPEGGITVTPSSFESVLLFDLTVLQADVVEGYAVQASSEGFARFESSAIGDFGVAYLYSDRAVSIEGTCVYPDGYTEDIDGRLVEGWNTIVYQVVEVEAGVATRLEYRVAPVPSGAEWYFVPLMPVASLR